MSRVPSPGGVLAVDKPVGPTSHDVVARARRALSDRRIGHTGTLDPFASGVLLLCCGPATRLSQFLTGVDKSYRATLRFGEGTDTLDREGEIVERDTGWGDLDVDRITRACQELEGDQMQTPPAFSAKKVDGEAAHRRARRGEEVELQPVPVHISSLTLVEVDLPRVVLDTTVSSGTYVRVLASDLAHDLGSCAHLTDLRRTRVGSVDLSAAISLDALEASDSSDALPWITPLNAVGHMPLLAVESPAARRLAFGQRLERESLELPDGVQTGDLVRLQLGDGLLGIAELEELSVRPRKMFLGPDEVGA